MNLKLPDGNKIFLDKNLELSEKVELVEKILEIWKDEIHNNWDGNSVRYMLEGMANFLVWHREEDVSETIEDKDIMSRNKLNRLKNGSKEIPFSNLSKTQTTMIFGEVSYDEE
jgi:hypothetical protein